MPELTNHNNNADAWDSELFDFGEKVVASAQKGVSASASVLNAEIKMPNIKPSVM